jgi:tetratricopeptide (TPR) repeat protein
MALKQIQSPLRVVLLVLGVPLVVFAAPGLMAEDAHSDSLRWMIFGTMLYKQDKLPDAEKAYKRATTLDPSNADAWQGLGNVLSDEKKRGEAARAYERAKPSQAPKSTPEVPSLGAEASPSRFAVGAGYPDVRLRLAMVWGWDVEAKGAFAQGQQAYSARLIWNYVDLGPLKMTLGGEGGMVELDGVDSLNGSGPFGEGFLGLEYPVGRFRLSVDVGEAYMSATSLGHTYSTTDIIYNTAVYLYLF